VDGLGEHHPCVDVYDAIVGQRVGKGAGDIQIQRTVDGNGVRPDAAASVDRQCRAGIDGGRSGVGIGGGEMDHAVAADFDAAGAGIAAGAAAAAQVGDDVRNRQRLAGKRREVDGVVALDENARAEPLAGLGAGAAGPTTGDTVAGKRTAPIVSDPPSST